MSKTEKPAAVPQAAGSKAAKPVEAVVYLGPAIPKLVSHGTVFSDGKIPAYLEARAKKIPAIRWENGKYEKIEEETVEDENIYFYIDFLQPRKFSTYPADLDDFAIGYCLGDGLVKSVDEIESIEVDPFFRDVKLI